MEFNEIQFSKDFVKSKADSHIFEPNVIEINVIKNDRTNACLEC